LEAIAEFPPQPLPTRHASVWALTEILKNGGTLGQGVTERKWVAPTQTVLIALNQIPQECPVWKVKDLMVSATHTRGPKNGNKVDVVASIPKAAAA